MKTSHIGLYHRCTHLIAVILLGLSIQLPGAGRAVAQTVVCDGVTISIDALNLRAEDIIRHIGEECGIRMVLFGDVFSDEEFSVQFDDMPIRSGLERVLRVVNIPNHMIHFETFDNRRHIVEINLIGEKGGERQLTRGAAAAQVEQPERPARPARRAQAQPARPAEPTEFEQFMEDEMQESFLKIMDEILTAQLEDGEEPDPVEILRMFQDVIPEEMRSQIPPEVLEELERLVDE